MFISEFFSMAFWDASSTWHFYLDESYPNCKINPMLHTHKKKALVLFFYLVETIYIYIFESYNVLVCFMLYVLLCYWVFVLSNTNSSYPIKYNDSAAFQNIL